jgi:hypothetical protein
LYTGFFHLLSSPRLSFAGRQDLKEPIREVFFFLFLLRGLDFSFVLLPPWVYSYDITAAHSERFAYSALLLLVEGSGKQTVVKDGGGWK